MLDRLKLLYMQDRYGSLYERCNDCEYWKSYYFDDYDSDCWCSVDDSYEETMHREKNCIKFKPKVRENEPEQGIH